MVTGAGSGIGRLVVQGLLERDFAVVLAGRTLSALEESANGSGALIVPTDVGSFASVAQLFETVAATFGRIDVLFNNAGVLGPSVAIDQISEEEWAEVIRRNLTGAILLCAGCF